MIDPVANTAATQGLGTEIQTAGELRMDFLKLLTTQLANQDPLKPMDNEAMVQQLATFSQLEQLEGVNQKLEESMSYSQSLNNTMMMDIVGKRVTVLGNDVQIEGGKPSRTLVRTVEPGIGYARVYDENGLLVRSIENIEIQPGFSEVKWDGLDENGDPLPDGNYQIQVAAERIGGDMMSVATFQSGIVDTVQFDDNRVNLMVNGKLYSPSSVVEVGVAHVASIPNGDSDGNDEGEDAGDGDEPGVGGPGTGGSGDRDGDPASSMVRNGPLADATWASLRGLLGS